MSSDGSIIAFENGQRWTLNGGLVNGPAMRVYDMSGDGSVFTGFNGGGIHDGSIWTQANGFTALGPLADGTVFSDPYTISSDGKIVIGNAYVPDNSRGGAARWTKETGMVFLDRLPDGTQPGGALGVSADGSVIAGQRDVTNQDAWIWREGRGSQYLGDVLVNEFGLGSQLAGWDLRTVSAISADGRTIVGIGRNPNYFSGDSADREAFIAFLGTPVPEPSTLAMAVFLLFPIALRRNTRSQLQLASAPLLCNQFINMNRKTKLVI